jgi:hypothetical protein
LLVSDISGFLKSCGSVPAVVAAGTVEITITLAMRRDHGVVDGRGVSLEGLHGRRREVRNRVLRL